jgi:hypothetical protein
MRRVEFEPTIPVFEQVGMLVFNDLDHEATVIG